MVVKKELSVLAFLIVFILGTSFALSAHKYLETKKGRSREEPVLVPDHQVSWAAYEEIKTENQVDYYRFTAKKGEEIYASLIIPKIDRLSDFNPELALIGPGLQDGKTDGTNSGELPLDVREGEGVLVKEYRGENEETFFEPFTQTRYWEHQVIRKKAPEDGTYFIGVWDAEGKPGKYTLAIGEKGDFGPKDILDYPSVWWKVRIFAERELSTYIIAGTVLTGLVGGSVLLLSSFL